MSIVNEATEQRINEIVELLLLDDVDADTVVKVLRGYATKLEGIVAEDLKASGVGATL